MSTYSDEMLAARFAALATEPLEGDWLAVQRRAWQGHRRKLTLMLAAALAAIAAGSALALGPRVVDFFSSEPAPGRIVRQLEDFKRSAALDWGDNVPVVASEARTIIDLVRPDGSSVYIAVAPTTTGKGFCMVLTASGSSGGTSGTDCNLPDELRRTPMQPGGASTGDPEHPTGWEDFAGYVAAPGTDHVEIHYEDGSHEDVPVTWVSDPIDAGFFAFDPAAEHLAEGHRAVAVVAVDASGKALARTPFTYPDERTRNNPWRIPPFSDLRWPPAIDQTTIRPLPIFGLPSWVEKVELGRGDGGFCFRVVTPPLGLRTDVSFGGGCITPASSEPCCRLRYWGPTGERIDGRRTWGIGFTGIVPAGATVELRFEDGSRETVQPVERVIVYLVPKHHYARGTRLTEVRVVLADGTVYQREAVSPKAEIYYRNGPTP
jgi:hypothetical protein